VGNGAGRSPGLYDEHVRGAAGHEGGPGEVPCGQALHGQAQAFLESFSEHRERLREVLRGAVARARGLLGGAILPAGSLLVAEGLQLTWKRLQLSHYSLRT